MRINHKAPSIKKAAAKLKEAEADAILQHLKSASFVEIDNWVDSNVTKLAAARSLFKKMLMVMSYLLNR